MSELKEALQKLDANNDNHWTEAGLPRLETVKFNNGGNAVTRDELEAKFPGFTKATADTYWDSYVDPANGAPQGTESGAGEQGSESGAAAPVAPALPEQGSETPSAGGEGAAPSETKAPDNESNGGDAGGEAELEALVEGLDDDDAGADEIAKLEETFQEIQEHLTGLRGQVDDLNAEIDRVSQIEQKVSVALEKAKQQRGDHKPANAIQEYLASQKAISEQRGEARKALLESGISLKELAKLTGKSPLDQSMARPTARRGRGSKGM